MYMEFMINIYIIFMKGHLSDIEERCYFSLHICHISVAYLWGLYNVKQKKSSVCFEKLLHMRNVNVYLHPCGVNYIGFNSNDN